MGAIFGAVGGVAYTAIASRGTASREQYTEAAIIGALPFGLGMRGAAKGLNKARRLRGVTKHFDSKTAFALSIANPARYGRYSLRPEAKAIGTGVLANYAVRKLVGSRESKSSRGGSASTSTSMHESAPSASKLRRMRNRVRYQNRKRRSYRCKKVSRGRRCKLPRGHSGRHSYA